MMAMGASHHLAIGSKAPLNKRPERAESRRFTTEVLPTKGTYQTINTCTECITLFELINL
jgi:hypothetical protein